MITNGRATQTNIYTVPVKMVTSHECKYWWFDKKGSQDILHQIPYKFEQAYSADIAEEFANLRK
jgi:hypothetical protein